jgi:hypothetical protein
MMQRLAGIGLVTFALLLCIGGVWWWALVGMSEEVGAAAYTTGLVTGVVGMLLWMFNDV